MRNTADPVSRDGFAVHKGFLQRGVVSVVRAQVEDALRSGDAPGCERPHNRLIALRWDSAVIDYILDDVGRREVIRSLASALDLRWISAYVSVKDPSTPPLWWHQDWWCWDHPVTFGLSAPQVALLIYLSETTVASGALRILPGSHRRSVPLHSALPEAHAQGESLPLDHPALTDQPSQKTLNLSAGDAVLLDYRVLHGTHPNVTAERRDAVLLSFTPKWDSLPDDVRGHLIQHPCLPATNESFAATSWRRDLLPSFNGVPRDLPLNRVPPAAFVVGEREASRSQRLVTAVQ